MSDDEAVEAVECDTTLVHFKVETCMSVDPRGLCEYLFEENQYLCVLHKGKNENPHWHFQGYLAVSARDYDKRRAEIAAGHSKKIANPKSRPVKSAKKCDETGFQYMMKEDKPNVVCYNLFTQEELDELHEKSAEHVDALKNDVYHKLEEEFTIDKILRRTVKSKKRKVEVPGALRKDGTRREGTFKTVVEEEEVTTPMEPKEVHQAARMFALEHYVGLNKMPPPPTSRSWLSGT